MDDVLKVFDDEMSQIEENNEIQEPDPVRAVGVGLRESEWKRIRIIAKDLSMKPHELSVWAMRDFLARYDAGEIPIQIRQSLPMR